MVGLNFNNEVNTIGAGVAFLGAILNKLSDNSLNQIANIKKVKVTGNTHGL